MSDHECCPCVRRLREENVELLTVDPSEELEWWQQEAERLRNLYLDTLAELRRRPSQPSLFDTKEAR